MFMRPLIAAAAATAIAMPAFALVIASSSSSSSSPLTESPGSDVIASDNEGREGTCQVSCAAPNLIQENEPCGVNTINVGCDGPPPHQFLILRCPEGYCASSWAFQNMQDTDWYLTIVNDSNSDGTEYVCYQLISEFPAVLELYSGTCGSLNLVAQGETDNCVPVNVCACLPAPAQYLIKVYPGTIAGGPILNGLPCTLTTRDYTIEYMCQGVCPGSGACCYQIPGLPGFICTVTTQQDCVVNLHGIYQGNNTTCQPDPCNPATGACCYLDNSGVYLCTITTQSDCENNLGGVYFGDNSICPPPPLSCDQMGACCYQIPGTTGFTCIITTQADCVAVYNGTYLGNGTSCNPDPCSPTGACCHTGATGVPVCTVTTQQDCVQNLNGTYLGDGTTCTPDPCPSGACCHFGPTGPLCTVTTQVDCFQNLNGMFLGNNTTCVPNPCVEGACCFIGPAGPQCTITTEQDCLVNLNGVFQGPFTTCHPFDPCVQGACCFQEPGNNQFFCTIVTQAQCATLLNSTWQGANTTCQPDPCDDCVKAPPDMVSWWTLDDPSTSTIATDAGGHPGTLMNGTVAGVAGAVGPAFQFDGINDHIVVPHHSDHNFNCGPFSADAWVRLAPNQTGGIILEKWGSGFTGWSFLVDGSSSPPGALTVLLGTTSLRCIASSAPSVVTPGAWTHVAFTASTPFAGSRVITFYINGVPVGSGGVPCDCVPSVMPLFIGAGFFGQNWPGRLDEIELFDRELSAGEVQAIYNAGSHGKCKHHCHANWDIPYCANTSVLTTTVMVCNDSGVPQTYQLSFNGTNTVPAMICNGPIIPAANFTVIGGNTVNVPPATCVPVQVQIVRPAGLLPGQTSCYVMTVTNPSNGHVSECHGSVMRTNTWCWIVECCTTVGVGTVATAVFNVTNTADQDQTFTYTAKVTDPDMMPDTQVVRLNGLPPGERVIGTMIVPVGDTVEVPIDIEFLEHQAFSFYDLLISGDENNDGDDSEVVISLALNSAPGKQVPVCYADVDSDSTVGVLDLLAVINNWGDCPPPPPPGCPGDVAPPGGDGSVDVSDLLAVINAWGQCP